MLVVPVETKSLLKFSSKYNLNSYPLKVLSDTLNTRSLSRTTLSSGLILESFWSEPPVDPRLTVTGIFCLASINVSVSWMVSSSTRYTKKDPVERPVITSFDS